MKLNIISVQNIHGISKKTQKPYNMYQAFRVAPLNQINSDTYNVSGSGLSAIEMSIDEPFFNELFIVFSELSKKTQIVEIDFELTLDSFNNNVLSGFTTEYKDILKKKAINGLQF